MIIIIILANVNAITITIMKYLISSHETTVSKLATSFTTLSLETKERLKAERKMGRLCSLD